MEQKRGALTHNKEIICFRKSTYQSSRDIKSAFEAIGGDGITHLFYRFYFCHRRTELHRISM